MKGAETSPHESSRYQRKALPRSLVRRALRIQQKKLYRRFAEHFPPSPALRVLDVGVNAALTDPRDYFFQYYYPYEERIVACGLEPSAPLTSLFPRAKYVQTFRDQPLPFDDQAFDVVFCNAVIEHVGSRREQVKFLADLLRVGKGAFVTTPNRWYPIEFHTMTPFLHYLPAPMSRQIYRSLGFDFFAEEANLNLLDSRALTRMVPSGRSGTLESESFLGLPSNLLLIVR